MPIAAEHTELAKRAIVSPKWIKQRKFLNFRQIAPCEVHIVNCWLKRFVFDETVYEFKLRFAALQSTRADRAKLALCDAQIKAASSRSTTS